MNPDKYKQYNINNRRYPGDFAWVSFYSATDESGIRSEDYLRNISACTSSEIINLSGNNLYHNPGFLQRCVRAVQNSAHTINLSFNNLYLLSNEDWDNLCDAIPFNISEIDLSNNKLGRINFDDFKRIFNRIPPTVTDIFLYNTNFNYPEDEFQTFITSHGNRIKTGSIPEKSISFEV